MKKDLPRQLFLVDLDDTLLDTTRLKTDLFLNIAQAIGSQSPQSQQADDIKRLYRLFCQKNQGIVSYQGFADFLKNIFTNQEVEVNNCFTFDFKKYLLPQSKAFLTMLKEQGTVIIWTAGTFSDQRRKLLDTGLLTNEEKEQILAFKDYEAQNDETETLPHAIVDTGKVLSINQRLNWFLEHFPDLSITLIDNEAKNIAGVVETKHERLSAIWLDRGEQKNPKLAETFRREPLYRINRFNSLDDIMGFLKLEGAGSNPEQRG